MNFIAKLQAWVKSLPPPLQTLYYSVETAVVIALGAFFVALEAAIASDKLSSFDWHGQLHLLWLALAGALVKAAIDLLKSAGGEPPTQEPPKPPSSP